MEIVKSTDGDRLTLVLSGSFDSTAAPLLEEVLIPGLEGSKNATLDFKDIKYVSSSGLRVLLMGSKKARANGGKLSIINVSSFVMEIFDVTGFADILNIE